MTGLEGVAGAPAQTQQPTLFDVAVREKNGEPPPPVVNGQQSSLSLLRSAARAIEFAQQGRQEDQGKELHDRDAEEAERINRESLANYGNRVDLLA